ncbi:hypothetical protein EDF46_2328 [Frondihabitans sp. PhB188]|uniref:hypothetical protein n=1 Tax=Frondihabitans sp. PhB188 TaxID=2485200 RepID=UPI000F46C506|nr:hypothetical protein [Frondihabitans sp. PhB188]ROQ38687.1 hypothetical protein EDF46_2328 [Frondihabitans sp. PhB188]
MLTTIDDRALAFVNLHGVLGALGELCARVPEARALVERDDRPTSIGFAVRGGPRAALRFADGGVTVDPATGRGTITLPFAGPRAFNKVIAGTATPIPVTGLHRIAFLTGVFAPLAELLTRYLRPSADDLADEGFRDTSTVLTLVVALGAVAELATHDRSGRASASLMPDGDLSVRIGDAVSYTLRVADHRLTFVAAESPSPRAILAFADMEVARGILAGDLSALACVCDGRLAMSGYVPMVDNVSRILDRAGQYLS